LSATSDASTAPFLQHLNQLFLQLADKLGLFPATIWGNIRRVMGLKPMGNEVGQTIVVNISEGLIGLVSFFDVVSD
jgi:hypothetical protein